MPLSAVALIDPLLPPPDAVNTTVSPPVASRLPAASLARRCSVATAPDASVSVDAVTTDVAPAMAPGLTTIVGAAVDTGAPLIVAPIVVAVPAMAPVNVAV